MPHPTQPVAVRHPLAESDGRLDPAVDYDPSDVLVKTYPWAFVPREASHEIVESVDRAGHRRARREAHPRKHEGASRAEVKSPARSRSGSSTPATGRTASASR
jgi:hypothetical protein